MNRKTVSLALLVIMLLPLLSSFQNIKEAQAFDVILGDSADTFVCSKHPTVNYGTSTSMTLEWTTTHHNRLLVKFDLTGQTAGHWELSIYCHLTMTYIGTAIKLFSVTDDTWVETTVNWNTQPANGTLLDTASYPTADDVEITFSSDALDTFINTQIAGDLIASFKIFSSEVENVNHIMDFSTKQDSSGCPSLRKINGLSEPYNYASEDAAVAQAYPTTNYDDSYYYQEMAGSFLGDLCRTYLKFNVSESIAGTWNLWLYLRGTEGTAASEDYGIYSTDVSPDSSWSEASPFCWNLQYQAGNIAGTELDSLSLDWTYTGWVCFNGSALDGYINSQIAGDGYITFCFKPISEPAVHYVSAHSKELGGGIGQAPYLERLGDPLTTAPFGSGWNPPFDGFYSGGTNPYNSTEVYAIDENSTVRVNLPFQHCLLYAWGNVSYETLVCFYIREWNSTFPFVLGYKWSRDNETWSDLEIISYISTDDFYRAKYDVTYISDSPAFDGFLVEMLGDYDPATGDVRGSHEIYFFTGNITDWANFTIDWECEEIVSDEDRYFYNPFLDSATIPDYTGFWGCPSAVAYNQSGSYIYSWVSTDENITSAWIETYLGHQDNFAYVSMNEVYGDPMTVYENNGTTQPQSLYYPYSWINITTTASEGYDFTSPTLPVAYNYSGGLWYAADWTFFTFVRSSDSTVWLKFQNLTAEGWLYTDGGWVNETQVSTIVGAQSPQLSMYLYHDSPSALGFYYFFLWGKGDTVYLVTLNQYAEVAGYNTWTWANPSSVYSNDSLDATTLHIMQTQPYYCFVLNNTGLYFGTLIVEYPPTPPSIIPPPPPIYVTDAVNMTFYFRSDTHTIHDVLGYKLGTTNTYTEILDVRTASGNEIVQYGFRVWAIDIFDNQYELTSGSPVALINFTTPDSGMKTNTWLCPQYRNIIDSIMIKTYQRFDSDPWSLRRVHISSTNLHMKLPSSTWTFYAWGSMAWGSTTSTFGFGDYNTYNSRVFFQYYNVSPWELAYIRLYQHDIMGFMFTPWTYFLGDLFWTILLFACIVSAYMRFQSWKPILALLWVFGGAGSILWALIPAVSLHIAVLMLALAMAATLFKIVK